MLLLPWTGLGALFLSTLANSAPTSRGTEYVVHEETSDTPHGSNLHKRSPAAPELILPIRIGLQQNNLGKGHDLLMKISEYDSPDYGKLYTPQEVADIFAPSVESVDLVKAWIIDAGIPAHRVSQSSNRQWIQFDASIAEANSLLHTEHFIHESTDGRPPIVSTSSLKAHIDYVTPGINGLAMAIGSLRTKRTKLTPRRSNAKVAPAPEARDSTLGNCSAEVTPACIFALYNLTEADLDTPPAPGNELGIYEGSGGMVYVQSDLDQFNQKYVPERRIPAGEAPTKALIDGAPFTTDPNTFYNDGETMLDFEVAVPIVYPQKTMLYVVDDYYYQHNSSLTGFGNTFLDALDGSYCSELEPEDPVYPDPADSNDAYKGSLQCGVFKPANVISVSFALAEDGRAGFRTRPARYQIRQCNEYMKLGLQGTTLLFASGDNGIDAAATCRGENKTIFVPTFPANCPYVLSVGGTALPVNASVTPGSEVATTNFASGGGFSNIYETPSYQKQAVDRYLKNYAPDFPYYSTHDNISVGANGGIYNRNGRGYPDVSALGQDIATIKNGTSGIDDGTSAATPIWAAMITKINDMRINAGKGPVGFINPLLYAHPEIFNDVTEGTNGARDCGVDGAKGFTASPGWDPVTGLGTPNFDVLKRVLLDLP